VIEVTQGTADRIREWARQGLVVYRGTCSNFGCLADVFSPHDLEHERVLCPQCSTMGGGFYRGVTVVDPLNLRVVEPEVRIVEIAEIEIEVTPPPSPFDSPLLAIAGIVNLELRIRGYWRPIEVPYFVEGDRGLRSLERQLRSGRFWDDADNRDLIDRAIAHLGARLAGGLEFR